MLEQTSVLSGGAAFKNLVGYACAKRLGCLPHPSEVRRCARVLDDGDLVRTCLCLFENNLNVARTAEKLYMHRNTLIYRIKKIKRLTGLNVCDFYDATTFLILYACRSEERR